MRTFFNKSAHRVVLFKRLGICRAAAPEQLPTAGICCSGARTKIDVNRYCFISPELPVYLFTGPGVW